MTQNPVPYLRVADTGSQAYYFAPATNSPFVADYIGWRNAVSDASPEFAEALALLTLAVIAGPNLRIPVLQEPRPIACNLFILLLGESTSARKSSSQKGAEALIEDVYPETILENPGSPEGFVQDLKDHEYTGSVLIQDEFAGWLAALTKKAYLAQLKDFVLRAYDGSRISRRLRTKTVQGMQVAESDTAEHPVLSFLANGTPDRIAMLSSSSDVEDGWWPRWAIVWPERWPPLKPLSGYNPSADSQRARLLSLLKLGRTRVQCNPLGILTDDAWPLVEELSKRIEGITELAPIYERTIIRTLKVAALLAFSEDLAGQGNIIVQRRHVEDADRLVSRWLHSSIRFADRLGSNEFENHCARVIEKLKREGGTCDLRRISQLVKVQYRYLSEVGQTLEMRGLISMTGDRKQWTLVSQS